MTEISRETFLDHLHDALNHLYNADQLRKSQLAGLFGVGSRFDTSAELRKILTDAIESLKPPASEPDNSKAWRTYESLYCCFIQQLNQQVAADQLCISPRQLRREQHNALEQLADVLWQKYRLDSPALPETEEPAVPSSPLAKELDWLMEAQPLKSNRLIEEIQPAIDVFQSLALKNGVTLQSQVTEDMPGLAIHSAAFNQILVSLLDLAIHYAGSGLVNISAHQLPVRVEITIQITARNPLTETYPETGTNLEIATELARLSGGRLYITSTQNPFPVRLILPALEQFPILVIDDNEDSLKLLKRYAAGTRYDVICTRETEAVISLCESIRPRIIVLDIMMPRENGWIVLGRLRQHPLTTDIPIIICTVLPQERLALSLGANSYLKKPVSRQAFLAALDQQFTLLEPDYS